MRPTINPKFNRRKKNLSIEALKYIRAINIPDPTTTFKAVLLDSP